MAASDLPLFPWIVGRLLVLWLLSDISYTVKPYEQAVVLRFGKYHATTMPGSALQGPDGRPGDEGQRRGAWAAASLRVCHPAPTNARAATAQEDETLMLTGDLNTASVEWTVQWKVTEPARVLVPVPDGGQRPVRRGLADHRGAHRDEPAGGRLLLRRGHRSQAERHRARMPAQDVQRILDAYACGITVTACKCSGSSRPNGSSRRLTRSTPRSRRSRSWRTTPRPSRNKLIPEARANRDKLIREAEGYASSRRAEANGEIEALLAKYHAYQRAPEITRQRLYLEAMQDVLQGVKNKTIIDADLKQLLPLLNLDHRREPPAHETPLIIAVLVGLALVLAIPLPSRFCTRSTSESWRCSCNSASPLPAAPSRGFISSSR